MKVVHERAGKREGGRQHPGALAVFWCTPVHSTYFSLFILHSLFPASCSGNARERRRQRKQHPSAGVAEARRYVKSNSSTSEEKALTSDKLTVLFGTPVHSSPFAFFVSLSGFCRLLWRMPLPLCLRSLLLTCRYDSFLWKCSTPKIHQIEKLRFLGIAWCKFKLRCWFLRSVCPRNPILPVFSKSEVRSEIGRLPKETSNFKSDNDCPISVQWLSNDDRFENKETSDFKQREKNRRKWRLP